MILLESWCWHKHEEKDGRNSEEVLIFVKLSDMHRDMSHF